MTVLSVGGEEERIPLGTTGPRDKRNGEATHCKVSEREKKEKKERTKQIVKSP
jgi:hypothetical protein